jgi:hypothetical protein
MLTDVHRNADVLLAKTWTRSLTENEVSLLKAAPWPADVA